MMQRQILIGKKDTFHFEVFVIAYKKTLHTQPGFTIV